MAFKKHIAVDLGASNGRVLVADLSSSEFRVVRRFVTHNIRIGNNLFWDILAIFHEIKEGIKEAMRLHPDSITSIGIDTWGVDYALLDKNGALLGNPYMYRDPRTNGVPEDVFRVVSKRALYSATGSPFAPFTTIYQLWSMKRDAPEVLAAAHHYLSIPDLLNYWLTGVMTNEFTHASTTGLMNVQTGEWDQELLKKLGLPKHIFKPITKAGTVIGNVVAHVAEELNISRAVKVVAVGSHDSASAAAAVPVAPGTDNLFLSSGTWSILGVETPTALLSDTAMESNIANEGTVVGGVRACRNLAGMWILQECKRHWETSSNKTYTWEQLSEMARANGPVQWRLDTTDAVFFAPNTTAGPMPSRIAAFCERNGFGKPTSVGEIVRGVLQGLAQSYASAILVFETLCGKHFDTLHIVGGGCREELLCQLTADATGKVVLAGPPEATALGNILMQALASNEIQTIQEGRNIIRQSHTIQSYRPKGGPPTRRSKI